jgi:hypothetical protein
VAALSPVRRDRAVAVVVGAHRRCCLFGYCNAGKEDTRPTLRLVQ